MAVCKPYTDGYLSNMWNPELIHASITFILGIVGALVLAVSVIKRQLTRDQPDWGHYKSIPARARMKDPKDKLILGVILALISLTAIASLVTLIVASRS
jgi:hypothetical protein